MAFEHPTGDPVICHCLGITESEIRTAGEFAGCETLSDVKTMNEAGSGCTSCHRRIIALMQESRQVRSADTTVASH